MRQIAMIHLDWRAEHERMPPQDIIPNGREIQTLPCGGRAFAHQVVDRIVHMTARRVAC